MGLSKATLLAITADENPRPKNDAKPVPVQFNPTSLRLQFTNQMEGNQSRGRQRRQYIASSSTKLTLQLIFDTADDGPAPQVPDSDPSVKPYSTSPQQSNNQQGQAAPVARSVRELTGAVAKFMVPEKDGSKDAPPKLRFQWGNFIFDGIMESYTEENDLFAEDGTPLRAKVDIVISEQKLEYQFLKSGPGASQDTNAPTPTSATQATPGTQGGGQANRNAPPPPATSSDTALDGESASDFLARNGLDPSAWRAIADQFDNPLSLPGGLVVDLPPLLAPINPIGANYSIGGPLLDVGAALDVSASIDVGASLQGGISVSTAGGVQAAVAAATNAQTSAAVSSTRGGFAGAAPAPSSPPASNIPMRPEQPHPPLQNPDGTPAPQPPPQSAPPLPAIDPRTTSFGRGVPLRPLFTPPADRSNALAGNVALQPRVGASGTVPITRDPTVPPWVALPASDLARAIADQQQGRTTPLHPCGCTGPCGHFAGGGR